MKRRSKINQDVQFVKNQVVKVPRTTQYLKTDGQGTFNAGDLIPFKKIDVLPGDTHSIKLNTLIRTTGPLIKPVAGVIELHIASYFVPFRITWRNGDKFIFGYQDDPDGTIDPEGVVPGCTIGLGNAPVKSKDVYTITGQTVFQGSVGDMLGLPCGIIPYYEDDEDKIVISALYARGYCLIWNNGYRDESIMTSISVPLDDAEIGTCGFNAKIGSQASDIPEGERGTKQIDGYYSGEQNGADFENTPIDGSDIYGGNGPLNYGKLLPVCKKRDQFTSCLPQPQKGEPVGIGLAGTAPVEAESPFANVFVRKNVDDGKKFRPQLNTSGAGSDAEPYRGELVIRNTETNKDFSVFHGKNNTTSGDENTAFGRAANNASDFAEFPLGNGNFYSDVAGMKPYVDLRNATAINVNDLRLAVQTQLVKEIDARYGTRAKEGYSGHFGVITADSRLQIPEFLGSCSILLNINQVVQNSSSTEGSPQANLAAFSQTSKENYLFTKSFTEFGFVMLVCAVRSRGGAYSQGIEKSGFKRSRFDHYFPEFDHIGEQPVKNRELFLKQFKFISGESDVDIETVGLDNEGVFGYQQAGYEHRYLPNSVHGLMRPDAVGTLAYGNLSYDFKDTPTLSPEFLVEDKALIDRALAYPCINPETGRYTGVDQFQVEFGIEDKATRPMSLRSIPGLMDHSGRILL